MTSLEGMPSRTDAYSPANLMVSQVVVQRSSSWLLVTLLSIGAVALTTLGLWAIAAIGWTEIYADQWRLYVHYLALPFPDNVLALENGHRPIFPGLVRVAEIYWLDGNQRLQLLTGGALALATASTFAYLAWHDEQTSLLPRSAGIMLAAFAVFWLGNARMLLHGNESVHAYLLTGCLAGALALLLRGREGWVKLFLACVLAFVATFSFGPGLAIFPALWIVLVLQRRYYAAAAITTALLTTLLVYFTLPGAEGVRNSLTLAPIENLQVAVTWLMSMPVNLFLAVLDPESGRALPGWLYRLLNPIAQAYEFRFGSIWTNHWPATLTGALAGIALTWATWTSWHDARYRGQLRLAGLAIAWFAVAVAAIVALGRLEYFQSRPDQIFANRYLPWSCLFWLGLAWVVLGRPTVSNALPRQAAIACSVLILSMALFTTRGHVAWGTLTGDDIRLFAAGLAVGVVEDGRDRFGESFVEHVDDALPIVRNAKLSMFSWPEAKMQGNHVPSAVSTFRLPEVGVEEFERIDNRLSERYATRLEIRFEPRVDESLPNRLLVLDAKQTAVGLLVRMKARPSDRYRGYVVHHQSLPNDWTVSDSSGTLFARLTEVSSDSSQGAID